MMRLSLLGRKFLQSRTKITNVKPIFFSNVAPNEENKTPQQNTPKVDINATEEDKEVTELLQYSLSQAYYYGGLGSLAICGILSQCVEAEFTPTTVVSAIVYMGAFQYVTKIPKGLYYVPALFGGSLGLASTAVASVVGPLLQAAGHPNMFAEPEIIQFMYYNVPAMTALAGLTSVPAIWKHHRWLKEGEAAVAAEPVSASENQDNKESTESNEKKEK